MDPGARLGQLRERAAGEGAEWLRSKVEGMQRDELQSLAAAAGVRVREGGEKVNVQLVRDRLLEKLVAEAAGPRVASGFTILSFESEGRSRRK